MPRLGKTLVISTNDREVSDEESRSERFLKVTSIYLYRVVNDSNAKTSMIHPIHTKKYT